ncbi:MAG: nucleotidyltransferase family protein [Methanothrix sp.]
MELEDEPLSRPMADDMETCGTKDAEKPAFEQYERWLKESFRIEITEGIKKQYDYTTERMKFDFEKSAFWTNLMGNLLDIHEVYKIKTNGYNLFNDPSKKPEIKTKSFDSFLLKTYRKNILENDYWPRAPKDGWIIPENWILRINDVIRLRFVVKYIDGVSFLVDQIGTQCRQCALLSKVDLEAKEEGYYAAHLYAYSNFEILKLNAASWETEIIKMPVEIQITTELQENIVNLLHKYYEDNRKNIKSKEKWQWNYKSEEFAANYLGHILHYLEGMIVGIRDKKDGD